MFFRLLRTFEVPLEFNDCSLAVCREGHPFAFDSNMSLNQEYVIQTQNGLLLNKWFYKLLAVLVLLAETHSCFFSVQNLRFSNLF